MKQEMFRSFFGRSIFQALSVPVANAALDKSLDLLDLAKISQNEGVNIW